MITRVYKPLISVIVPVYKAENYLTKCVESIIGQTYSNLEIILVDDGSPDGCPNLCDNFCVQDERIKVIHKTNGGVSSARNAGLDISKGEFISFVDADDFIKEDFLQELVRYDADIVVSGATNGEGLCEISCVLENYYKLDGLKGPCGKLYKYDIVKNVRFREELSIGEDIIFNLEVLRNVKNVFFVQYSGYCVTANPESLTRSALGKYDYRMDEEWQKKWGEIQLEALNKTGISQSSIDSANANGCSVWIYQKISNYCYKDCPHSYKEKIKRIRKQLDDNRESIMSAKTPVSPKTFYLIKLCICLRSGHVAYLIFKLLNRIYPL